MKKLFRAMLLLPTTLVPLGLTGCLTTTRAVRNIQPAPPGSYKSATVEELEKEIQDRDTSVKTLNATVEMTATTGGGREGQEKTYPALRGFIVVRRPDDVCLILQLPVVGSTAAYMVGDEKTFTMLIPPFSKAYTGTNEVKTPSPNALENLRPPVFFDSLLVPGIDPDDWVTVTSTTRVIDPGNHAKNAIAEPVYDLTYLHVKTGKLLEPERVIRISRMTMLPFSQDVYDKQGRIVTHTDYANFQPSPETNMPFPRSITITRPLDELKLHIDITKLTMNEKVQDDQFALKIPSNYKVQEMK